MTYRNVVRLFSAALIAVFAYGCDDEEIVGPSTGLLQVDPLFVGIDEGTSLQLTATLNGVAVAVTWESSDEAVATVSANGLVTGVAPGRVAIIATAVGDPTQERASSVTVLEVLGVKLTSGVPVTGVSSGALERSEGLLYHITVPSGATALTVTFTGGSGDGDIYVQRQIPPDDSGTEIGCHSFQGGNNEACTVADPEAGTWYIFVAVWDPYADGTLTATFAP